MITQDPDYDIASLKEFFTTAEDYDAETILDELLVQQKAGQMLCLIGSDDAGITGFIIGFVFHKSLWIDQSYHRKDAPFTEAKEGFEMAKEWAREKGLTSITGETQRGQERAMGRFGFKPFSTVQKCKL